MRKIIILLSMVLLISNVSLSDNGLSDLDLTSRAVLEATQEKAYYEGMKEEAKSEMFWLRTENILLKVLICYMAVNND